MTWFLRLYLRFLWNKKITFTQSDFFGGNTLFLFRVRLFCHKKKALSFLSRVNWQFLVWRNNLHGMCIMFSIQMFFFFVAARSICTTQQMLYYPVQLVTRRSRFYSTNSFRGRNVDKMTTGTIDGNERRVGLLRQSYTLFIRGNVSSLANSRKNAWRVRTWRQRRLYHWNVAEQYHCQNLRVRDGDWLSCIYYFL